MEREELYTQERIRVLKIIKNFYRSLENEEYSVILLEAGLKQHIKRKSLEKLLNLISRYCLSYSNYKWFNSQKLKDAITLLLYKEQMEERLVELQNKFEDLQLKHLDIKLHKLN